MDYIYDNDKGKTPVPPAVHSATSERMEWRVVSSSQPFRGFTTSFLAAQCEYVGVGVRLCA